MNDGSVVVKDMYDTSIDDKENEMKITKQLAMTMAQELANSKNAGDVDGIYNVLEATARAFKKTDEAFDKEQYINYALKMMTFDICPIYNEAVLPDEDGNCSLCKMHLA